MEPLKKQTFNPWITIWFTPRKTYLAMLLVDCFPLFWGLAIVMGVFTSFSLLSIFWQQYPENILLKNFWFIIFWGLGGAIYGILYLYIGSWLYTLTGRWIKGIGTFKRVQYALGWAFYPPIVSGVFHLIALSLSQYVFFQTIFLFLSLLFGLWGFILFLHMIGEAHEFSVWRALVTLLISSLLVLAVFTVVVILIGLIHTF